MRLHLPLLAFALVPALALAQDPAPPPADVAPSPADVAPPPADLAPPPADPHARFGVALGVGVPQATTIDLIYRPLPWLRVSAGPTWHLTGWGLHGGVLLSPVRWAVSPTLGVEVGRLAEVDLDRFVSVDAGLQPLLQRVEVRYVATTLGLEIGSQRGFAFSLRMGLAWLQAATHGTGRLTDAGGVAGQEQAIVTVHSPVIRASTPTLQLVFQYFI